MMRGRPARDCVVQCLPARMPAKYVNMEIIKIGGITYSIKEYGHIFAIDKSPHGRKAENLDQLRSGINSINLTKHYLGEEVELLLSYVRDGIRFSTDDARLAREVLEPMGPRQLKLDSAHIAPHVLYTCPSMLVSKLSDVFAYFAVMFNGRAPTNKKDSKRVNNSKSG